jgi:hypothetical protein
MYRLRITFEDLFNNYDGALDSIALKAARQHDEHLSCSNGMSGCTVLAACGVRTATTTSKVKAAWTEGDKFLTATEHNELIVDIAKNAKLYTGATVSPASSITDAVNRRIALSTDYSFTDNVYKYYWIPEGETIATYDMPEKYRGSSSIDSARLQALGDRLMADYHRLHLGTEQRVLVEEQENGLWTGYTNDYTKAFVRSDEDLHDQFVTGSVVDADESGIIVIR